MWEIEQNFAQGNKWHVDKYIYYSTFFFTFLRALVTLFQKMLHPIQQGIMRNMFKNVFP